MRQTTSFEALTLRKSGEGGGMNITKMFADKLLDKRTDSSTLV